ncbi:MULTISPECIES: hypothetical protein [Vibrio]|jgi:hypothetical protein|uniref:hypothetical protein n=1 Tax=Vibrio TaxID=662 RepID=UPI000E4CCE5E|nr:MULTISPECIES: hypothetical protein [Vibrio]AXT74175.1 hypothetical protein DBX26_24700 [Vibrio sp. dhg]EJM7154720.1 hypothetical protein [Vibrio parahaemolyticus]EJS2611077.1 hypothetical protein [Vibrio alginolyticus]MCA2452308.1 hypothetical protein [Vibrio alginolyticus]MCA2476386.1 hypothetical protein [Vibrio alginolyticus]
MTTLDKNNKFNDLNNQIGEILKYSNELNIPLSIAFELNDNVELVSNDQCSGKEQFENIKTLHESKGDVTDFLLSLCKLPAQSDPLNNVKSHNNQADFTMTNSQVLSTKH